MTQLPLHHYRHLKRLADLRRITVDEAAEYLSRTGTSSSENWLEGRFGTTDVTRKITFSAIPIELLTELIQGLPRNIRPVTDGPYLDKFDFFSGPQGLLGIEANGVKLLDYEKYTQRDEQLFDLVKDLLPNMSIEQYRIYNTFNSQYLRLTRQPELFTMPKTQAPAIDAGCYVGYKAHAMAHFLEDNDVLAFEVESDNFEVLKLNSANNPQCNIRPIRSALSDTRGEMILDTRNSQTMAHSLTPFDQLKEVNVPLASLADASSNQTVVETNLLDDFTQEMDKISAVHISVNGHEPEVCGGAVKTLQTAEIIRVSCPYIIGEKSIFDIVSDMLEESDVTVFGKSGAAVIAGKSLGSYHIQN